MTSHNRYLTCTIFPWHVNMFNNPCVDICVTHLAKLSEPEMVNDIPFLDKFPSVLSVALLKLKTRLCGSDVSHQCAADFSFNLLFGVTVHVAHTKELNTLELGAVHAFILLRAPDGTFPASTAVVPVISPPVVTGQRASVVELPGRSDQTVVV